MALDVQNRHLTNVSTQSKKGGEVLSDGAIAVQYSNFIAYSTSSELAQTMK